MCRLFRLCVCCAVLAVVAGCAGPLATIDPLLQLRQVHPFGATALAYNDDGSLLATGGRQGELRVWRMPEGTLLYSLAGDSHAVRGLAWVDDVTLIGATGKGRITRWDLRSGRSSLRSHATALTGLVYLPASRQLITSHKDGHVRMRAADDFRQLAERELDSAVLALTVNRDGTRFAASTTAGRVYLLDGELRIVQELARPPRAAWSLRFSPDGRRLAAGGWFELMMWGLDSGQFTVRNGGHPGKIISLDFTPDGKRLVSLGRISDSSLIVTDIDGGVAQNRLDRLPLCGWMLQVSPDGRYVAAGSEDGSVHVYEIP